MPKPSPEVRVRADVEGRDGRTCAQATRSPPPGLRHSTMSSGPGTGYLEPQQEVRWERSGEAAAKDSLNPVGNQDCTLS